MKISIAGAGSGKTTKMADKIINCYENTEKHLNIYCIAFTNNAADHIKDKLSEHFGETPERIKVSTIHSFLYQEIIRPYYYLLYGRQYGMVSNIKLPTDPKTKNWKINELDKVNILHLTAIPQRAKWVMVKKSGDKKHEKNIRKIIQSTFIKYCGAIYIDEAQDIDGEFLEILKIFESIGIQMELMGDPKQDLKGFGNLRKLVEICPENVNYITECHRCPQKHLDVSNLIVRKDENQKSQKSSGTLSIIFESESDIRELIDISCFDLKYISAKNERFETHNQEDSSTCFDTLNHEIGIALTNLLSDSSEITVARCAYYYAGKLINSYQKTHNAKKTMSDVFSILRFSKQDYAKIIQALQLTEEKINEGKILVSSIESIKGKEGNNCFFVLTTDLAEYLFAKKSGENKTKNKLYVALTRSLDKLTILIANEVEEKYGRGIIHKYINCR